MAGWFAKLMEDDHDRSRRAAAAAGLSTQGDAGRHPEARDARYDAAVQRLRDRDAEDRAAREKRQRGYKQHLERDAGGEGGAPGASSPVRLDRVRTKVPCRVTPEARALLDKLKKQFPRGTVTLQQVTGGGRQAVMLTRGPGFEPKQIGWVEHAVQSDPRRCNVRHQGLSVETDGHAMLVLRFRYPPTAARVSATHDAADASVGRGAGDEVAWVDFAETRPALELRPTSRDASPRLVWVTRREAETLTAVQSRDYEAFYVRFKLEVLAGIWSALSALLSSARDSRWHQGAHYTVVREPDAVTGKIFQRTVDDGGRTVDIGSNRAYDAAPATDILLLYLDGDVLADFADIYFTLQSFDSADAYFLKEEFFAVVRRFWASAPSLASRYGSDLAAVVRMSQRAAPMPAQAPLLKQDWTNLRQSLVDRYGVGGRKAAELVVQHAHRPRIAPADWPFASFPAGDVNVGLRVVHRQEWRRLGADGAWTSLGGPGAGRRSAAGSLDAVVGDVARATAEAMKWPLDIDGRVNTGVRGLAARTDAGLERECRESSRDTSARLDDVVRRAASELRADAGPQHRFELFTRPHEIRNVVLVAERLPAPAEIDLSWVRRHDWILAKALLDESYRETLDTIRHDAGTPDAAAALGAQRDRLCEHLRANILHYQRAVWRQEDPQQRSMRYRKAGMKVPLEWRFELEQGGALSLADFGERLAAPNVDGQFAAYSAGREAHLDQVIDPAGPIGHYGNYAVYDLRPEFGSADLFAMLHFFKSPYLHPHPETGEPVVVDPAQIQIAEDPAVAAASDQAIGQHRAEMFQCVPELRLELARAREKVRDGTDPGAVDRLQRQSGALRRHFAAYLFRRERTRRIVLDTDARAADGVAPRSGAPGRPPAASPPRREPAPEPSRESSGTLAPASDGVAAIAVVRGADPTPLQPERGDAAVELRDALAGDHLILESGRGVGLLSASGQRDAGAGWQIHSGDAERTPSLLAGAVATSADAQPILARGDAALWLSAMAGGGAAADAREPVILARSGDERTPGLRAGRSYGPDAEWEILSRVEGALPLTAVAGAGTPATDERTVLPGADAAERAPSLIPGAGAPYAHEPVILPRDDEGLRLASVAGGGGAAHERVVISADGAEAMPSLGAGRAHDPEAERLILPRGDDELRLTAVGGGDAARAHEQSIVAGRVTDETPPLLAGAGGQEVRTDDPDAERVILALGDGEWMSSLLSGGGAPHAHDAAIHAAGGAEGTPTLGAGRAPDHPEADQVILVRGDAAQAHSLLAGGGAAHADAPAILALGDDGAAAGLRAGRVHDPKAEPAIVAGGDGKRTPNLLAGAGTPRPRERAIIARKGEWSRLTPVGDTGAAHPHDPVILAADEEWLRPSLVAGWT